MKGTKSRKNGCTCPFHLFQIVVIVYFFVNISLFGVFWIPGFTSITALMVVGITIYGGLSILQMIIYIILSCVDHTDRYIKLKRSHPEEFDRYQKAKTLNYCQVCLTNVSKHAKHCKRCNKCVNNFDHHCKAINNCVAGKYYGLFIFFIIISILTSLFQIAMIILDYSCLNFFVRNNFKKNFKTDLYDIALCLLTFNVLTNALALMYLFYLLIFHFYLMANGMTTYEYILSRKNKIETEKVF